MAAGIGSKQFVVFRLANENYAFDISHVIEIQSFDTSTKVHKSAPYIEGVMNLRGKLVTVVNLRRRFGMEPMPSHESAKIIIVGAPDAPVGFIVDEVSEVVRASPESIEDTPTYVAQNIESDYVLGIIKQGDRLVTLVDPIKILELSPGAETGAGGR